MDMRSSILGLTCILLGLAGGGQTRAATPEPEGDPPSGSAEWGTVVIHLKYANAEELARVLRELLPGVRVVAYPPTNSLLIAGDRAALDELQEREARWGSERSETPTP